jgi:hypothetical protein
MGDETKENIFEATAEICQTNCFLLISCGAGTIHKTIPFFFFTSTRVARRIIDDVSSSNAMIHFSLRFAHTKQPNPLTHTLVTPNPPQGAQRK